MNDPQGQAEATVRMREINQAYRVLARHFGRLNASAEPASTDLGKAPQRRLSREEIEGMVDAIGSEGPLDTVLGAVGWIGSTINGLFFILFFAGVLVRVAMILWSGNLSEFTQDPGIILFLGVLALLWLHESRKRHRLRNDLGGPPPGTALTEVSRPRS